MPGHKTISAEKQCLIAIWKMATPDSYRSICEKFNVGRATALKAVRRVTKAIVKLASIFIVWPEGDRAKEVMTGFAAISAFPKVIGAIDGTHINIKAPHVNPDSLFVTIKDDSRTVLLDMLDLSTINVFFAYLK
ncbi:nuclease harbi1 [Lasius niger]|uniref:Nuclease harbi1 n=1 Tax=Lasius niger TaxID=67767 RepID=A0A0J7K6E5_LASNI|nr:nuclease harbi1 [Lasius niger]